MGASETKDVGRVGGSGHSNFVQDDPPFAPLPLLYVSPAVDLDVDSEESDEEYVADSNDSSSSEEDEEEEFVPETSVDASVWYLLPAPQPILTLSVVPSHYHILDLDAMHEDTTFFNMGGNNYNIDAAVENIEEGISKLRVTHCDRRASMFVVEELEPFEGLVSRQEDVLKVYEVEFPPIPNEKLWPEWYGARLHPNPARHKKAIGAPVSMRFCNGMDERERQEKRYGLCRQSRHTWRGYPNQPTEDT
ncbi:hypothetical protein Ahy_A07g033514 [Arachis hypogaea]|uniref:Uncharacterized protein n=1 Tax=Arachis hypogaea TaxID=3818 RepID=A0A445C9R7_ARAHY|nr:hypothetical protein Ahy_A07g033514 [Arachis hypogaea]